MKKIIIAILSTMLMTQSIVPVIAEGTLITEFSEEQVISETNESSEEQTITSFEELEYEKQTDAQINSIVENEEIEMSETENISEVSKNEDLISGREYLSKIAYGGQPYRVEYSKLEPTVPVMYPIEYTVDNYQTLKNYLQSTNYPDKIKLTSDIIFPTDRDANALITIPSGVGKELDLNGYTIEAGNRGQIEVQGDYFKIMNGTIIGGYGDESNVVPSEDVRSSTYKRGGFIFAPSKLNKKGPFLENDIVFENITHRNTDISETGSGGFIAVNTSNLFFKGDNTLTNGNYNIKGGSITFMDGKFVGRVTRQTNKSLGFDSYGRDGTINIGFFGYGTDNYRNVSNQFNGDKRVTVLEDAEVELYNLNKKGHKWYNNCIGNFAVITVDGSLKMYSTYPPLRSILSETHNEGKIEEGYIDSKARTYNGLANININEGATFIAEAQESDGTHGTIFTYNTTLNIYQPAEVDIDDMSRNTDHPFFHSGNKNFRSPGSSLSIYDTDMAVWPKNRTNNDNEAIIWTDVIRFENSGFYSFLNGLGGPSKGRIDAAEPNGIGLGNFNILNYGRLRSEGDFPQVIPDKKYFEKNIYTIGNGDGVVTGPGVMDENGLFYGTSRFRKLDEFGRVVPVVNGEVILRNDLNPNEVYRTQTNQKGEWVMDLSKEKRTVGWYTLMIDDGDRREGALSRRVKVYMKDNTPPTGKTKLLKIEEGTTESLLNAFYSIDWAKDETSPDDKLTYEYLNLSDQERLRIIATPGLHNLRVGIYDEVGNELRLDAQVLVYKKGTDPDLLGYIEGHDFEIDGNMYKSATLDEKREFAIQLGEAKGFELNGQGYDEVTSDKQKFQMEFESVNVSQKRAPIILKLVINGKVEATKTIYAKLIEDSIVIKIFQVEEFYKGDPNDAKKSESIYFDLENKLKLKETVVYYPLPKTPGDTINIDDFINKLENENRLQLERQGYKRIIRNNKEYVAGTSFWGNTFYSFGKEVTYQPGIELKRIDIFVEYTPITNFMYVPDLTYGDIEVTNQQEKTHTLELSSSGSTTGANRATVINTKKEKDWSINLAVKDNKITNEKNEQFIGGLIYFKNGQEFDITGSPITLESYSAPNKDSVDLIKEVNFYSQKTDEGIRLKEKLGNSIGNYSGDLIWTLTSAPIP